MPHAVLQELKPVEPQFRPFEKIGRSRKHMQQQCERSSTADDDVAVQRTDSTCCVVIEANEQTTWAAAVGRTNALVHDPLRERLASAVANAKRGLQFHQMRRGCVRDLGLSDGGRVRSSPRIRPSPRCPRWCTQLALRLPQALPDNPSVGSPKTCRVETPRRARSCRAPLATSARTACSLSKRSTNSSPCRVLVP